jgi:hypothetical protein
MSVKSMLRRLRRTVKPAILKASEREQATVQTTSQTESNSVPTDLQNLSSTDTSNGISVESKTVELPKTFQYEELSRPNGFRLLVLHPGQGSEEIVSSLANDVDLDNPGFFCAVSYTWGSSETPRTIKVNGCNFPVTVNLHCCLSNLRRPETVLILWIDAICINQKSVQEKSVQVPKMTMIYEKARQVLVWLGPLDEDAMSTVALIRNFYNYAVAHLDRPEGLLPKVLSLDEEYMLGVFKGNTAYNVSQWRALQSYFGRSWWNRVWTLQEGTSPAETMYICGDQTVSDIQINATTSLLTEIERIEGYEITKDLAPVSPFLLSRVRATRMNRDHRSDLFELLRAMRSRQATDPRDKVFAALPMARDVGPGDIPTDYKLDTCTVYMSTVKFYLEKKRDLDFLQVVGEPILPGLPSWAPDWSGWNPETPSPLPKVLEDEHGTRPLYAASARLVARVPASEPIAIMDGTRLTLKGVRVDSIASVSSPGESHIADWGVLREWATLIEEPQRPYRPAREQMSTAFWRTMTADFVRGDGKVFSRGSTFGWSVSRRDYVTLSVPFEKIDLLKSKVQPMMVMKEATTNRRLAHTSQHGFIGLVPRRAEIADVIYVVHGSQVPLLLRKSGERYIFIGECYVHGIMDGECFDFCKDTVETLVLD